MMNAIRGSSPRSSEKQHAESQHGASKHGYLLKKNTSIESAPALIQNILTQSLVARDLLLSVRTRTPRLSRSSHTRHPAFDVCVVYGALRSPSNRV